MAGKEYSIGEKWAADLESIKNGAKVYTSVQQCERCKFNIADSAIHCKKYINEEKPEDVMFTRKECLIFEGTDRMHVLISDEADSKLYGGIFGFVIADALGVPVEFSSRSERDRDPVQEMRAYGTYMQPLGAWSDDSSLMFCLIDALHQGFSIEKLKDNMISYYRDGAFTPEGKMFDIGIGTANAIQKMMQGINPVECGGEWENSNGNGSLMRILPLAFITPYLSSDVRLRLISDVSSLTHRHKRSILACIFYIIFAENLIAGRSLQESYERSIRTVKKEYADDFIFEMSTYKYVLDQSIVRLDRRRIKSSGYVVDSLEAVIWSLFNTSSYKDAVLTAVNLGGDTDTIAALTGGLAGIYYGFEGIPDRWVQNVIGKERIAGSIKKFSADIEYYRNGGQLEINPE